MSATSAEQQRGSIRWRGVLLGMVMPIALVAQAPLAPPAAHRLAVRPFETIGTTVPAAELRRVAPSGVGLVLGGVAGAAFGTFIGMAACSYNDDDQTNCTVRMPLLGLSGALVGGGLGWAIGRLFGR